MKDYALVTYANTAYVEGLKVLIKSFLKYNPWFFSDIIIFDWGLTVEEKTVCSELYSKIIWTNVDKSKYTCLKPEEHYFSIIFQKGELLKIRGYTKIIVMDADLIVLEDVSSLFTDYNNGFYVNNISLESKRPNTGLMVIDQSYCTDENYKRYLEEMNKEIHRESKSCMDNSNENVFDNIFDLQLISEKDRYSYIEFLKQGAYKIIGCSLMKPWGKNALWKKFCKDMFKEDSEKFLQNMIQTKKLLIEKGFL